MWGTSGCPWGSSHSYSHKWKAVWKTVWTDKSLYRHIDFSSLFLPIDFFFFSSNRCFLSFSTERNRVRVKGIVPPVFNLCSIEEGFYNSPGCVISSRPHSRELECMVHWGKGARVWAECLAGLPWPWIKHHKARGWGERASPGNHNLWSSRRRKSKRIEIIKLGTISSGISTVTAVKARPVYRSLSR